MNLYHYTAMAYLPSILEHGLLAKAENPTSFSTFGPPAVFFTTDPSPKGHGLVSGRYVKRNELRLPTGAKVPYFPNKRKVRIQVEVEGNKLHHWFDWSDLEPRFRKIMVRAGGGMQKAKTWYFTVQPIPVQAFKAVEIHHRGSWVPYDQYDGPCHEEVSEAAQAQAYAEWGAGAELALVGRSEPRTTRRRDLSNWT